MLETGHAFSVHILGEGELAPAVKLVWEIFQRDNAPFYSQQGVDTFHDFLLLSSVLRQVRSDSMCFWGCFDGARLAGVCALRRPEHVSLLFVDAPYRRRGAASRLMRCMEEDCRARGVAALSVNADLTAVDFYRAAGFQAALEEQYRDGIRYLPMVNRLEA